MVDEQRREALKRMKMLQLHGNVLRDFKKGQINASEGGGFLYWTTDEEEKHIVEFEGWSGGLVYHIIRTETSFGKLLTFLYVSKYKDEWDMDIRDLIAGKPLAYVKNLTADYCSEFGCVGIQPQIGGIHRYS